jgi:hypothetical protein
MRGWKADSNRRATPHDGNASHDIEDADGQPRPRGRRPTRRNRVDDFSIVEATGDEATATATGEGHSHRADSRR